MGDHHDPGLRRSIVWVVPNEDDHTRSGGVDRRVAGGIEVDAVVPVSAGAATRLPPEAGAAELLRNHAVHRPVQLAVVHRRDLALAARLPDELVDLVCQLVD